MGWEQAKSESNYNANDHIKKQLDNRGQRDTRGEDDGFGMSQYSIIGIKASEVETMRGAIRAYVGNIEKYLEDAITNANAKMDNAFRGNALQESVKAYLTKVKDYCDNLVSHLLTFSDKLADVSNAWLAATQSMSQNVDAGTSSFGAGTRYTDNATTNSR